MYTLESTGIYLVGDFIRLSKLVPYEEIKLIRKINLLQSIYMGWNPFKPGMVETYMGVTGDPLYLLLIETDTARYLLRGFDIDQFIVDAKNQLSEYRANSK